MRVKRKINQVKEEIKKLKDKKIGFVPTMGFLHEGHLSLVHQSNKDNDINVVSVFVNPTQFGPGEDFSNYPRDFERDEKLLKDMGVDILFYPDSNEMYPQDYSTYVEVEKFGKVLCGNSRPIHFRGVTTVVLKLLHIVTPTNIYFGQKDAQQAIIIKKMIKDLNLDVNIKIMPIVRDKYGLALSSRNSYLSKSERKAALFLPNALNKARFIINEGLEKTDRIRDEIIRELEKSELIEVDYVEVVSLDKLERIEKISKNNTLVASAIRVGKTKLIDNFVLGEI